jgi:hypothetical protein
MSFLRLIIYLFISPNNIPVYKCYGWIWSVTQKGSCVGGLDPSCWCYFGRFWKFWRWDIDGRSSSLGEDDWQYLVPSCFLSLSLFPACYEVNSSPLPHASAAMMFCPSSWSQATGLNPLKLWAKRNILLLSCFCQVFVRDEKSNEHNRFISFYIHSPIIGHLCCPYLIYIYINFYSTFICVLYKNYTYVYIYFYFFVVPGSESRALQILGTDTVPLSYTP